MQDARYPYTESSIAFNFKYCSVENVTRFITRIYSLSLALDGISKKTFRFCGKYPYLYSFFCPSSPHPQCKRVWEKEDL